jgi:predicted phosphodiesterase
MKLLITADWHVRGDSPRCRTDEDWVDSQRKDIQFIVHTAKAQGVDAIMIVGDVFHQPRAATEAVNMVLEELKKFPSVYILPGNHDLPYHDYANIERSSIGTLLKSFPELGKADPETYGSELKFMDAQPFGLDEPGTAPIRFVHRLVFPNAEARPIEGIGQTAEELAEEFKGNDIIICGDYHHAFIQVFGSQMVINPGCINIQAADMMDYSPVVFIADIPAGQSRPWRAEVRTIPIPQMGGIVTDAYLRQEEEREDRMEAFLTAVSGSASVTLSFRDNLEKAAKLAPVGVQAIITELIQELSNESK